ncbi:hypothetical protein [Streptomyces sp. NPDC059639]|uniref:hypothetical protein n=1 Tax=Streptomyces sp. NPDC059639 TaxID=3346891 RepID=UPI0036D1BE09
MSTVAIFLAVVVTGFALLLTGSGLLFRSARREGEHGPLLQAFAVVAAGLAALMYAWGMLFVAGAVVSAEGGGTDSAPLRPCRSLGQEVAFHTVGYDVDYVPLRFVCVTSDGGHHPADAVPGYVNPALAVLGLTAAGLGAWAAVESERRARRVHASGDPAR